jgi:pyruvate dehydrogenase phosphatase
MPTRSFGDFYLKFREFNNVDKEDRSKGWGPKINNFTGPYINYRPEIKKYEIRENDKYLILATDGLWDELKTKDVEKII